ncbi:MAG: NADH:ubiquinone reductase (Na(+)-transporting) subunit C [Leptospirales bacterium]
MQRSNLYTFGFAFAVTLFCSIALALASTSLKPAQEISARLDVIKNILSVAGYDNAETEKKAARDPQSVITLFEQDFTARVVDKNNQEVSLEKIKSELQKLGYEAADLDQKQAFEILEIFNSKIGLLAAKAGVKKSEYDPGYSLLFLHQPGGQETVEAYIVPVEGYGLWDMIFGYIALQPDLVTVKDIRFYKHKETPGLGGEISTTAFTNQFKGKKILDEDGSYTSIGVVKGKVSDVHPDESEHYVDGISGGTITGRGVTDFLYEDLKRYNAYFETLRSNEGGAETARINHRANTQAEAKTSYRSSASTEVAQILGARGEL